MKYRYTQADAELLVQIAAKIVAAPPDRADRMEQLLNSLMEPLEAQASHAYEWQLTEDRQWIVRRSMAVGSGGIHDFPFDASRVQGESLRNFTRRADGIGSPARSMSQSCQIRTIVSARRTSQHAYVYSFFRAMSRPPFTRREVAMTELICSSFGTGGELIPFLKESLTTRAKETLAHLRNGLNEREIAMRMGISINTVHHYVKEIYRYFNVASRGELLSRWINH